MKKYIALAILVSTATLAHAQDDATGACEQLKTFQMQDVLIDSATPERSGSFTTSLGPVLTNLPAFWALASRGLQGAAAAGAIALINSLGNIGGFLGPFAIGLVKERTGSFAISMLFIASCLAVGAGIVVWERAREQREAGLLSKVA